MNTYLASINLSNKSKIFTETIDAAIVAEDIPKAIAHVEEQERLFGRQAEVVSIKLMSKYSYWVKNKA
jgi:hypothetical protein